MKQKSYAEKINRIKDELTEELRYMDSVVKVRDRKNITILIEKLIDFKIKKSMIKDK